jgi:hypothetical protein
MLIKYKMLPFLILIALDAYILSKAPDSTYKKKSGDKKESKKEGGEYKVYGAMWCGWTRKQLDYMKQKNIPHKFIDCEKNKGECGDIKSFPVVEYPSGKRSKGFTEV